MKNKVAQLLALFMLVSLVVTACGPTPPPQVVKETVVVTQEVEKVVKETVEVEKVVVVTATPAPKELQILTVGTYRDVCDEYLATPIIMPNFTGVWEPLFWVPTDMSELKPNLATAWKPLDDLTWQFSLKQGVTFHNGEPFNAEAVKYSLERIKAKVSYASRLAIDRVEVVDEFTVNVITAEPRPNLPELLTHNWTIMLAPKATEEGKPVGTGPFMYESHQVGREVVLVRNEDYHGQVAKVDKVIFRFILDDNARLLALKNGEVDFIQQVPSVAVPDLANAGFQIITVSRSDIGLIALEPTKPPTDDENVRRAVAMSIDWAAVAKDIHNDLATPSRGFLPPGIAYSAQDKMSGIPFDLEGAAELLEQNGWVMGSDGVREKDGQKLELDVHVSEGAESSPGSRETIEFMQATMLPIGIKLNIKIESDELVDEAMKTRIGHLYFAESGSYSMELSSTMFDWFMPGAYDGAYHSWLDPELDLVPAEAAEWLTAMQAAPSKEEKEEQMQKLLKQYLEDSVYIIPLPNLQRIEAATQDVQGYQPHYLMNYQMQFHTVSLVDDQ
jgi:peptide/nickel transport system substrate-binding protein